MATYDMATAAPPRRPRKSDRRATYDMATYDVATYDMAIPSRYTKSNPMDLYTPQNRSDWAKKNSVILRNKVIWTLDPKFSFVQVYSIMFPIQMVYAGVTIKLDEDCCFSCQPGVCYDKYAISGRFARLHGPKRPLQADRYVEISCMVSAKKHLRNKEVVDYLSVPEEYEGEKCNEVLTKNMKTLFGIVEVAYARLTDAADCYVAIKLLDWSGEGSAANIYGDVTASNTRVTDIRARSYVFCRGEHEAIRVHKGQYIPLQRPGTAVSLGHDLVLNIRILHKKETGENNDEPIFEIVQMFHAKCGNADDREEDKNSTEESDNGTHGICDSKIFSGKGCKIELKVFWLPCWGCPSF